MKDVKSILCETCGHEKRFHEGSTKFCKKIENVEDCKYLPEDIKQKYLDSGVKELACCPCKEFKEKSINSAPKGCGKDFYSRPINQYGTRKMYFCGVDGLCPDCKKLNEQGSKHG